VVNLAVAARNASLKSTIGREIDIREDAMSGVKTAYLDRLRRRQLDLATTGEYPNAQHSRRSFCLLAP
jgi:hypothetical protein